MLLSHLFPFAILALAAFVSAYRMTEEEWDKFLADGHKTVADPHKAMANIRRSDLPQDPTYTREMREKMAEEHDKKAAYSVNKAAEFSKGKTQSSSPNQ